MSHSFNSLCFYIFCVCSSFTLKLNYLPAQQLMRQAGNNELAQNTSVRRATTALPGPTNWRRINNQRNFTTCNELQIFSWQNMWSISLPLPDRKHTRMPHGTAAAAPTPPTPFVPAICEFGLFATPTPCGDSSICSSCACATNAAPCRVRIECHF